MSADVFISFASQDHKIARTICTAIEGRGFTCWISSRDIQPGENFQSAIVRAIRSAKVLLLVFTENSNRSDEMTKELALASQQKLMVVPLRVENVSPSDAFAYEFATRQWIDLFADWEQAINQLSVRLSAALEDDRTHVDTIVLGKPSLQDPAAVKKLVAARKRAMTIGIAAVLVVAAAAGLMLPKFLSKTAVPSANAAASAQVTAAPAGAAGAVASAPQASASKLPSQPEAAANPTSGSGPDSASAPASAPSALARAEDAAKNATADVAAVFKPHHAAHKPKPASSNVPY